jgi:hypothetical protein
MKHIKIYENFQEGPMRKPEGFFSRLAKGTKDVLGIESSKDRESLETIHRILGMNDSYGLVRNAKEIKPGVIVAWLSDQSVTVDTETPEILWKGQPLDLKNIEEETATLYSKLISYVKPAFQLTGPGMRRNAEGEVY